MNEFERDHVVAVYNEISEGFAQTRDGNFWPCVRQFIDSLPAGSNVLEIGCGTGRNFTMRADLEYTGCDISPAMVKHCKDRGYNVVTADCRNLPFKTGQFDNTICVAVIHHLQTGRDQAIRELLRVTKPGGKILLTVWNPTNTKKYTKLGENDYLVPWKNINGNIIGQRYYHFFNESEVLYLLRNVTILKLMIEMENWIAIIEY